MKRVDPKILPSRQDLRALGKAGRDAFLELPATAFGSHWRFALPSIFGIAVWAATFGPLPDNVLNIALTSVGFNRVAYIDLKRVEVSYRDSDAENYEVVIQAAVPDSERNCVAEFDDGRRHIVFANQRSEGKEGLREFSFKVSRSGYIADHGAVRVRCKNISSGWIAVKPTVEKIQSFTVVVGDNDSHGGPSIGCYSDVLGWARLTHPDVCKSVTILSLGGSSGGKCGYSHYTVRCSTISPDGPLR
jgi:hypothetical protein